jgi:hypothetical protein
MFVGFNLDIDDSYSIYYNRGKKIFDNNRDEIKKELDSFVLEDGSVDGTKMQETWFPQINADIFISHSHKDEKKAIELAGWLKFGFGLNSFIDSTVWGYAGDLLKSIDDIYCLNDDGKTYSYERRNYSTSHVHMMLSTALSMMIDRTECIFFLNTPNSITASDIVKKTESPWIYSELAMTRLVRNRELSEYRKEKIQKFEKKAMGEINQLVVKYKVITDNLIDINKHDLKNWGKIKDKSKYPLDDLYEAKGLLPQTLHS